MPVTSGQTRDDENESAFFCHVCYDVAQPEFVFCSETQHVICTEHVGVEARRLCPCAEATSLSTCFPPYAHQQRLYRNTIAQRVAQTSSTSGRSEAFPATAAITTTVTNAAGTVSASTERCGVFRDGLFGQAGEQHYRRRREGRRHTYSRHGRGDVCGGEGHGDVFASPDAAVPPRRASGLALVPRQAVLPPPLPLLSDLLPSRSCLSTTPVTSSTAAASGGEREGEGGGGGEAVRTSATGVVIAQRETKASRPPRSHPGAMPTPLTVLPSHIRDIRPTAMFCTTNSVQLVSSRRDAKKSSLRLVWEMLLPAHTAWKAAVVERNDHYAPCCLPVEFVANGGTVRMIFSQRKQKFYVYQGGGVFKRRIHVGNHLRPTTYLTICCMPTSAVATPTNDGVGGGGGGRPMIDTLCEMVANEDDSTCLIL